MCEYCETTSDLRMSSVEGWEINGTTYICEEDYSDDGDGPCWDDLGPLINPSIQEKPNERS